MVHIRRGAASRMIFIASYAAAAVVAPAIGVMSDNSPPARVIADCAPGETEDPFTLNCVPIVAPGPPSELAITACSGSGHGGCVQGFFYGPNGPAWVQVPAPDTQVQSSP